MLGYRHKKEGIFDDSLRVLFTALFSKGTAFQGLMLHCFKHWFEYPARGPFDVATGGQ
jgi:hypothetical protein